MVPVQQDRNEIDRLELFFFPTVLPKLCIELFAHVNSKLPLCHTILSACLFAGVAFGA